MLKSLLTISALIVAGVVFVVMFPIIGVTLWVSLLAAGVSAVVYAVGAAAFGLQAGAPASRDMNGSGRIRMNPVVDVALMRARYFLTMAIAAGAAFLVVETFAFAQSTANTIGFALGIGLTVAGAALLWLHVSRPGNQAIGLPGLGLRVAAWHAIAALVAVLGGWQIVQSLVFGGATTRWLSFADGCALTALAVLGLVLHELSSERVVHSLEVIDARSEERTSVSREREPMPA